MQIDSPGQVGPNQVKIRLGRVNGLEMGKSFSAIQVKLDRLGQLMGLIQLVSINCDFLILKPMELITDIKENQTVHVRCISSMKYAKS